MNTHRAMVYERCIDGVTEIEVPIDTATSEGVECVEMRRAIAGYCVSTHMWIVYIAED